MSCFSPTMTLNLNIRVDNVYFQGSPIYNAIVDNFGLFSWFSQYMEKYFHQRRGIDSRLRHTLEHHVFITQAECSLFQAF